MEVRFTFLMQTKQRYTKKDEKCLNHLFFEKTLLNTIQTAIPFTEIDNIVFTLFRNFSKFDVFQSLVSCVTLKTQHF